MTRDTLPLGAHEQVVALDDPASGLRGYVAIHSTALGPAAGGCRVMRYASEEDVVRDAMRLSEGMSYKNALAGLPLGGGKAVIRLPDGPVDRGKLFAAFGRAVERLDGRYVTAEDVGSSVEDMAAVSTATRHVAGLPLREGQAGGDPSPWTALGVFLSIETAARMHLNTSLKELTVGVQGLGHVGFELCRLLHESGARLVVCDVNHKRAERAVEQFGAKAALPTMFTRCEMDVFAPCALGSVLDSGTVESLKAQVICGAANNQLSAPVHGRELMDRGVLYAPDYLVNAGGIINVAAEYLGESADSVDRRVREIPQRLERLIMRTNSTGEPMNTLADEMARNIARKHNAERRLKAA